MLAPLCAALALAVAAPHAAAPERSAARARARAARPAAKRPPTLERARAQLASVKRDPAKRRYRHHWERAIRSLTAAARGSDRPAALLEAARARYALYRFSQVESDRDEALRLAERARRAGAKPAAPFAAAVRREAGDDEPPRPARSARRTAPPQAQVPAPGPAPARADLADDDGEEPLDEALAEALAAGEDRAAPRTFTAEPAEAEEAEGPAQVSEVRSWSNADYTRVAIYLSRPASFVRRDIPAEGDQPRRLAIDVRPAVLGGAAAAHEVKDQKVQRVRVAQHAPDTVRVVLDLAGGEESQIVAVDDPPRILADVGGVAAGANAAAPGRPEGELAVRRPIRRIVVDAGHGGHDTGAIGPSRVREKDVTLAMARRLASRLEAQGFEVLLTRRDDRYLALEERTAFANAHRGDLFVSIHANAHPRRERRGTQTYVLNVADDRYAARLAARENGALHDGAGEGREVRRVLSDLDAQSSAEASRRLAQRVQRELIDKIRARTGEARDLGVKSALFYVLLGARMPAVLVETAFISNRSEERRLRDPGFQEVVAEAVARGVAGFARGEARVAAR